MLSPIILFAISYIAGIVVADYCDIDATTASILVLSVCPILILVLRKRVSLVIFPVALLFFAFGLFVTSIHALHVQNGIIAKSSVNPTFVAVYGVASSDAEFKNNASTVDVDVSRVSLSDPIALGDAQVTEPNTMQNNAHNVNVANAQNNAKDVGVNAPTTVNAISKASIGSQTRSTDWGVNERVRIRVRSETPLKLMAGEQIFAMGRLEQPKEIGDFDYKRYLYHKDIAAILTASPEDIKPLAAKSTSKSEPINSLVGKPPPNQSSQRESSLIVFTSRIREWIKDTYTDNLPKDSAALLAGIVLGDDSGINEKLSEDFRATGLTHILAASGMNIALVLAALWPILRLFRLKPSVQYVSLIIFSGLYTLVSGMQPSLTRAFLMAAIGLTAWATGRDNSGLASISAAALLLLIINPFTLFDIGFQLSFLATASLLVFVPMLDRMMADLPKWLRSGLSVTIAAQIGVLPVLIYYFGQISFVSVLANLLIVPLAEPALVIGIVLLPFYALIPFLALPFFWVLTAELTGVIYLNEFISVMPGAVLVVSEPSVVAVSVMYLIIVALSFALYKASLKFKIHFGHVVMLLVALMCISIWVVACRSIAPSHLRVTFFDVGQGDSALVQTPDGVKILIDTGPDYKTLKRKLDLNSVRFIDALIISHTHADHASGVKDVFLNFKVGTFYYPKSAENEPVMSQMLSYAKKTGVRRVPVANLDEVRFGNSLKMVSFCRDPENGYFEGGNYEYHGKSGSQSGENDKCIVNLIKYGAFDVMFTGDADKEMEQYVCKDYSPSPDTNLNESFNIRADVLKIGHHGSAASSTDAFLKNVAARVSVISVGKHNRYGHPSSSAISRIRASGSRIFRTDNSGDVTVESDGKGFRVLTEH